MCIPWKADITQKNSYDKRNKSTYIVEVINHYDLLLCIDGWDEFRGVCFNKGG